ncbi:unnamed protein product [Mytilus edulis]|uniref:DJ-1/PfpI domain-containing protein n=1 Tax=Mytilus edulis TaxID=6550 RepID=A0A8S3T399_MYTED|nr:unnamed protein product [Mytilus edulis]
MVLNVKMPAKVLFVLTSHDKLGATDHKTGWYLPEVAHPYQVLKAKGHEITFLSPKGGKAPMDPGSGEAFKDDQICKDLLANKEAMSAIDNTRKPSEIKASDFKAIFYAGGHGPMFDLPENQEIAKIGVGIYENGGIVSAVCHGPVGLVPLKLSNGDHLIKGKKVTSFTNEEEDGVQLTPVMPFPLETKLKELGGTFVAADMWKPNVQVDGRLITGQNPASATPVGEALAKLL